MARRYELLHAGLTQVSDFHTQLRQADRQEIYAHSGRTPYEALERAVGASENSVAAYADGHPLAIWGVTQSPEDDLIGVPWMMATDLLLEPEVARAFSRSSRDLVREMQAQFPILSNYTDARNVAHHRWLSWCGFKCLKTVLVGPLSTPFYEFIRI